MPMCSCLCYGRPHGLYLCLCLIFQTFFSAVIIGIWVIGITLQEIKHALHQGKERYFSAWWHLAVIPMVMCYIIAAVLWIVGYAFIASDSGSWTVHVRQLVGSTSLAPYHLLLLSNSFYSFAVVLTFFEASHILLANSTLGPLHLSLMNMGRDIMKFFALCGLNVCAFTLAFRKLYSQYMQTSTQPTKNNSSTTTHAFERYLTLSLNCPNAKYV